MNDGDALFRFANQNAQIISFYQNKHPLILNVSRCNAALIIESTKYRKNCDKKPINQGPPFRGWVPSGYEVLGTCHEKWTAFSPLLLMYDPFLNLIFGNGMDHIF